MPFTFKIVLLAVLLVGGVLMVNGAFPALYDPQASPVVPESPQITEENILGYTAFSILGIIALAMGGFLLFRKFPGLLLVLGVFVVLTLLGLNPAYAAIASLSTGIVTQLKS